MRILLISQLKSRQSFTLIELLIAIAIIGILSTVVIANLRTAIRAAEVAKAGHIQGQMAYAVNLYYTAVGFYPPDVNRGWDPGFVQELPWNPDAAAGEPPPSTYGNPGTNCSHCPSTWEAVVADRWSGPYLSHWPRFTPWIGKYDYNYWPNGATRSGCTIPPGIYIGVQSDYFGENAIPEAAELQMIAKGFDGDNCLNGESQMLLQALKSGSGGSTATSGGSTTTSGGETATGGGGAGTGKKGQAGGQKKK